LKKTEGKEHRNVCFADTKKIILLWISSILTQFQHHKIVPITTNAIRYCIFMHASFLWHLFQLFFVRHFSIYRRLGILDLAQTLYYSGLSSMLVAGAPQLTSQGWGANATMEPPPPRGLFVDVLGTTTLPTIAKGYPSAAAMRV
jgi:hypothetical protein